MERLYTNIIGTSVFKHEGKRPITTVKGLVIDPESGKVVAIIVNLAKNLIIAPIDVLSWKEVIRVHNHDSIIDGNEVLRVESVQKSNIKIIHNKVVTKNGKHLGKVVDLSIDLNNIILKKLHVAKGLLGLVHYDSRIISMDNVLEILPKKIIVKDDAGTIKAKEEKKVRVEELAVG